MNQKIVYQVDVAGRLLGPTVADESPMEPGVWLMPAGTVEVPPPPESEWPAGMWPRWVGMQWEFTGLARGPGTLPKDPAAALAKLQAFLTSNPDVAALIDPGKAAA